MHADREVINHLRVLSCLMIFPSTFCDACKYSIEIGLVTDLVKTMKAKQIGIIKEGASCIINMCYACDDACAQFFHQGIVGVCLELLWKNESNDIIPYIILLLSNIAGSECSTYRENILENTELREFIVNYANEHYHKADLLIQLLSFITNLIIEQPNSIQIANLSNYASIAFKALTNNDKEIILCSLKLVSKIADITIPNFLHLFTNKFIHRLVSFGQSNDKEIKLLALHTIAACTHMGSDFCLAIIDLNILTKLKDDLFTIRMEGKSAMRSQYLSKICFILSNLCVTCPKEFVCSIASNGVLECMCILIFEEELRIKIDAAWVLINCTFNLQHIPINAIIEGKMIDCLLLMFKAADNDEFILCLLKALCNLVTTKSPQIAQRIVALGGIKTLQHFQLHSNAKICKRVAKVLGILYCEIS